MLALKFAVFLLSLSLGIIASAWGRIEVREATATEPVAIDHTCHPKAGEVLERRCWKNPNYQPSGTATSEGSNGSDYGNRSGSSSAKATKPLKVTFKQKAQYTAEARSNGIEGVVKLRVTFLASGKIGSITTIQSLPYGLTEQAINAARKMRFEPEKVDGIARTTTRPVSFTFNIN